MILPFLSLSIRSWPPNFCKHWNFLSTLRLLAQDQLTYSMCLTKSDSFSDFLHLSLSLQQGKDLLRILTGFRSKYLYTYKRMYSPTLLPILKLHPYRITILNFTPF